MSHHTVDLDLKEKVAVVTGGGRGIGRAVAERLACAGATVVLTYSSSEEAAAEVVQAIEADGHTAHAKHLDVREGKAVDAFFEQVEKEFGRIDVLVNNAGIVKDGLIVSLSDADWTDVIQTNLFGTARCIRAVARPMMLARKGSIINLSSVAAQSPNRGQSNYASSKGAIEALTRQVAVELGRKNVRVNAVAPGIIVTDMSERVRNEAGAEIKKRILLRRFGTPEEVAGCVHFLASDASAYITGQVITVDGGIGLG